MSRVPTVTLKRSSPDRDDMGDRDAVEMVEEPVTVSSMAADLRDLGLGAGDLVLLHSSMSELGWVCGGPQAVVEAFREVLTESGTLVVPTHTPQYSNPERWSNPSVPDDWIEPIRESMPPFRPDVTPTWRMGAVPECFRDYPDVVRSNHPKRSFTAWGAETEAIVGDHGLDYSLGERSPLARIYERDGDVLLLGVGHDSNTSLHLAEYRADIPTETVETTVPVLEDGRRVMVTFDDIVTNADDFPDLGAAFEREVGVTEGTVGAADAKLIDQPALVDFAVEWMEANR